MPTEIKLASAAVAATTSQTDASWLDKLKDWVVQKDNWKVVTAIAVSAVAVGALGFVAFQSTSSKSSRKRISRKPTPAASESASSAVSPVQDTTVQEEAEEFGAFLAHQ